MTKDDPAGGRTQVSLQTALLGLVGVALLAGIVPAGFILEQSLARELEKRAWRDVAQAPMILADRTAAISSAMMMHAKEVAHSPVLIAALERGDSELALRAATEAAAAFEERPVLVVADGTVLAGPSPGAASLAATRRGEMPVMVVQDGASAYMVSIASIQRGAEWLGAAGVATPLDANAAEALAGLTRSDLVLLLTGGPEAVASAATPLAVTLEREVARTSEVSGPREITTGDGRYLVVTAPLSNATVAFVHDLRRELAILPELRRVLYGSGAAALAVALGLGSLLALVLVRPVRALAAAADDVSRERYDAPLARSPVREVRRVTQAFEAMRAALATRIEELRSANRALEERQARLVALQSELMRRERVAASGRMAAQLAHEIRNPVANLRNCLELLHRRLDRDAEGREFAELAIDELLRMHELTERMLDLNRPSPPDQQTCDAAAVAREVAALARIGSAGSIAALTVSAQGPCTTAVAADSLKQVLLNLVQNAREAMPAGLVLTIRIACEGEETVIDVDDNGPGVDPALHARIFDPFFTTHANAGGIGLGLFVVEGTVRSHGGTVAISGGPDGGARFRIRLPTAALRPASRTEARAFTGRP
ncbi:MAG: sensor histidine kinase [Longimicrobiales bacterium]